MPELAKAEPIEQNPYCWVHLSRFGRSAWVNINTVDGYEAFRWFLQDSRSGRMGYPSPTLGYVLSWMQSFLRAYGVTAPYLVMSGMREGATNRATEGAALSSLHLPDASLRFRAVDVEIPGVSGEYLGRLAALAKAGGVGFYGQSGHTHIDDGNVRYWRKLPKS